MESARVDEVKCEKIQRARESGHEARRGKVRPVLKFHEKSNIVQALV
jgi:hypothetical protein